MKRLFAARVLNGLLQMVSDKSDKIDLMHGIAVDEFALANVFWGFWFRGVVGLWGPVERAIKMC